MKRNVQLEDTQNPRKFSKSKRGTQETTLRRMRSPEGRHAEGSRPECYLTESRPSGRHCAGGRNGASFIRENAMEFRFSRSRSPSVPAKSGVRDPPSPFKRFREAKSRKGGTPKSGPKGHSG